MPDHDFIKYPELTNAQIQEYQLSSPHAQITEDFYADVIRVHDGDTITLRTVFRDFDFPLRLLGIDAPEMNEGGEVARDWLKNRILNNEIMVVMDPRNRVDKYGRLLGRAFHGGVDVGQEEIYLGLAKPFSQREEGKFINLNKIFALRQWLTF